MKTNKNEWVIALKRTLEREWLWALCPTFIGGKEIEGSRAFTTKGKAAADAKELAENVGLPLKSRMTTAQRRDKTSYQNALAEQHAATAIATHWLKFAEESLANGQIPAKLTEQLEPLVRDQHQQGKHLAKLKWTESRFGRVSLLARNSALARLRAGEYPTVKSHFTKPQILNSGCCEAGVKFA